MSLSQASRQRIRELAERYPQRVSATIPALYVAQKDCDGWVPREAMVEIAELLGVPPSHVFGVASFYTLFHKEPVGKHVIQLCTNIACALSGAREIVEHLERKLDIQINGNPHGATTADGKFTVVPAECLAACGGAPCMIVDTTYYENLTPEKVDQILEEVADKEPEYFEP